MLSTRDTGVDIGFDVSAPAAGAYRVLVSAAASHSAADYRLTLTAQTAQGTPGVPAGAISGTPLGDSLNGTAGNDTLYGLGGNDLINGGAGTDTAVFRTAAANLSINTINGLTAVRGNFAAGEHAFSVSRLWNVERLTHNNGTESLTTSSLAPLLGTPQADRITGTAGADLIDGLGGSDFIDGGAGADTLVLFGPRDAFTVTTVAGITRIRGADSSFEYAGHLIKTVNVETLAFTQNQTRPLEVNNTNKVFGSAAGDSLLGTAAADLIDGQGGNDTVDGGAGSDTLVFFARQSEFSITLPTAASPVLVVTGRSGEYNGQTVRATNIESIAFSDTTMVVTNPARVVLAPASTLVAEGGASASLAISLSAAPTAAVTVRLAGGTQLGSNPTQLSFNSGNWNQPQTVTISAADDTVVEKQHSGTLAVTVESSDPQYQGQAAQNITYSVADNDGNNLGAVTGRLWNDADRDGVIDAGEAALVGWRVFDDVNRNGRLDAGEPAATTDAGGNYRLDDLSVGTHTIVARTEAGWSVTSPGAAGTTATVIQNQGGNGEARTGRVWSLADLGLDPLTFDPTAHPGSDATPAGAGSGPATASAATPSASALANYANLGLATRIGDFHTDPRFADINGQGYAVVIIDTGADLDHPDYGPDANGDGVADRIVFQYDFSGANDNNASDSAGHGSHVAGTVGSSDPAFPGIAPEVSLIVLKVFPDGARPGANTNDIVEALNWVVQNLAKYNIVAVNMSIGVSIR